MSDPNYKEISADLVDFVSRLTQSVAEAQRALDKNAIETLKELANNKASIPQIRNIITEETDSEGNVTGTRTQTKTEFTELSLLNLGITPTFYQFAKTNIEVALDMQFEERVKSNSNTKEKRLLVSTKKVRTERRFNQNIQAYSKLSIEMVPVPMPINIPELVDNQAG